MTALKDLLFTPAEFARLADIDKSQIPVLEAEGKLAITKKKVGHIERKYISFDASRAFFRNGFGRRGDQVAPEHKVQMFYNVKGGTGKSTMTAQYSMHAAIMGLNVLAIDLDGQGHLTVNIDVLDAHERPSIYDVLINDLPIQDAIMTVAPGLDLIPANLGLCNIEIPLNNKTRREYRLAEAIAKIAHNYDLIVADTNPAASILNGSMLVASNLVSVVCATNPLSFHGMSLVMTTIEHMEREFRRELEVKIIPNMYDNREVISQEVLGELRTQFADFCTNTVVSRCVDFNEATKQRATVWAINAKGMGATDIKGLSNELLYGDLPLTAEDEANVKAITSDTGTAAMASIDSVAAATEPKETPEPAPLRRLPEASA